MDLIADILMTAGAFAAALYCYVLSRRLARIQTLEGGLGGAIAVLSAQVDDMTRALGAARAAAEVQSGSLASLVARGEGAAARLEMLIAALHDMPEAVPDGRVQAAPDGATGPAQAAGMGAGMGAGTGAGMGAALAAGTAGGPAGGTPDAATALRRLRVVRSRLGRPMAEAAE